MEVGLSLTYNPNNCTESWSAEECTNRLSVFFRDIFGNVYQVKDIAEKNLPFTQRIPQQIMNNVQGVGKFCFPLFD